MNRTFFILLTMISIIVSACYKDISKNNGNKYAFEPLPFKYSEDGNWGFIDLNGKVIIEPLYKNKPSYFQDGFAIISNDTVNYYITTTGDTIGSYYFDANPFSEKRAKIKNKEGEWFFMDELGNIVFKVDTIANNKLVQCRSFEDGLALFLTSESKYGYFNTNGNVVIEPKYSDANDFAEGLAYVEMENDSNSKVEKILINTKGEVVKKFDESLEWINPFNEGKAAFKDSSGCGYLNTKGEIVIKQQKDWHDLSNFINGYASYMCGGDWGVIDSTGEKTLSAVYEMPPFFYNGLAIIKENNNYGVINLKGKKVIECSYNHIAYPLTGDRYYIQDGKFYLMFDKSGRQIGEQEIYRIDLVSSLLDGFKTGYLVIGEKLGISLSNLQTQSSVLQEMRTSINNEVTKLYMN